MSYLKYITAGSLLALFIQTGRAQHIGFEEKIVSNSVALHPLIVDLNGDGKNEIVAVDNYVDEKGNDGNNIKTICWFSYPDLERTVIAQLNYRSCHIAFADIDNDGFGDIIGRYDTDADDMNGTGAVFWLKNPYGSKHNNAKKWVKYDIGFATYVKDFCTADFNNDGRMDVAARAVDHKVVLFYQQDNQKWKRTFFEVPAHDGTDSGDMDGDGDADIVVNGIWYENPGNTEGKWQAHDYAPKWYKQNTGKKGQWFDNNCKVQVADMDGDHYNDIVISSGEGTGYPLCWYKNPASLTDVSHWEEHLIGYMNFCHTLRIADFDNDGDNDVLGATLISVWNPYELNDYYPVVIFKNKGNSLEWEKQIISTNGAYGGSIGDVDNDGDIDFLAPRNFDQGPLTLWINSTDQKYTPSSISIEEIHQDGMNCFKVLTPSATYVYDREGGGFANLFDTDGNDWIGFKNVEYPFPGNAASKYRGIPNLGIEGGEDNDAGHPGFHNCSSYIIAPNVIETVTKSGNWKWRWVFYNEYAQFEMIKAPENMTYWFLYEGTPGGNFQPDKLFWGTSTNGFRTDFPDLLSGTGVYNNWQWVYVGNKNVSRVLYLKQQVPDELPDLFSYMGNSRGDAAKSEDGMVCFGFGRSHNTQTELTGVNKIFTIGFIDSDLSNSNNNKFIKQSIIDAE